MPAPAMRMLRGRGTAVGVGVEVTIAVFNWGMGFVAIMGSIELRRVPAARQWQQKGAEFVNSRVADIAGQEQQ